jgi:GNAT superfamily N-acetyltransferase
VAHARIDAVPRHQYQVARSAGADEHGVIVALARAFHNDPLLNFAVPDPLHQARLLLHFMRASVVDTRRSGEIWVVRREGASLVAGAALWLPPGAYPRGLRRDLAQFMRMMPGFPGIGTRGPAMMRLLREIDGAHPHDPHSYLAVLGVDPLYQRTGAGAALLAPMLERCDRDATPAYLETQKPENVPWYGRFGFEVTTKIETPGCPPLWAMRREPVLAG